MKVKGVLSAYWPSGGNSQLGSDQTLPWESSSLADTVIFYQQIRDRKLMLVSDATLLYIHLRQIPLHKISYVRSPDLDPLCNPEINSYKALPHRSKFKQATSDLLDSLI